MNEFICLEILGKGKCPVRKVKHLESGKFFAMKKIKTNSFLRHSQHLQELTFTLNCNHPYIVKIQGYSIYIE